MKFIFELMSLVAEGLLFFGLSALIGLWWIPEIAQGNISASFAIATLAIVAGGNYFTKHVIPDFHNTRIRSRFYTCLSVCALVLYFYGIFHLWL